MSYVPSTEDLVSRFSPVEICTAVICVWGRKRPEGSVTVPLSPARSTCASEQTERDKTVPERNSARITESNFRQVSWKAGFSDNRICSSEALGFMWRD